VAVVVGGLGQPEKGAIVALGLGAAEANPNALRATLVGSCAITATLTDGSTPTPEQPTTSGGGGRYLSVPKPPRPFTIVPIIVPAPMVAHLSGSSRLTARIDFEIDPDALARELALALLLDLV
jgi:hypothetical protein